jgi:hypothetical protein
MAPEPNSLTAAWGKKPCILPEGWLDLTPAHTDLGSLERLLRRLPEESLRVRITGDGPESGSPRRIMMGELPDLCAQLLGGHTLHIQATDLHRYDSGFAEIGQRFRRKLEGQIEELRAPSTRMTIGLFLSSGGAVAPFHADQEHNFLAQVVGDKQMHMFPPADLDIFPCESRERLAAEDLHMLDTYRPEIESRAEVAQLLPGTTLYHPPMSPHWVETGRSSYSLSITLSFVTPSVDRTLLLHKLNRQLRRIGMRPAPVGHRPRVDGAKLMLARAMRGLVRLRRGA